MTDRFTSFADGDMTLPLNTGIRGIHVDQVPHRQSTVYMTGIVPITPMARPSSSTSVNGVTKSIPYSLPSTYTYTYTYTFTKLVRYQRGIAIELLGSTEIND